MFYLYFKHKEELGHLDLGTILSMALFHDLPEYYTGDVCAVTGTPEQYQQKDRMTLSAIQKISEDYVPELAEIITKFEEQSSEESIFVNSVDKLSGCLLDAKNGWYTSKFKKAPKKAILALIDKISHPVLVSYKECLIDEVERNFNG